MTLEYRIDLVSPNVNCEQYLYTLVNKSTMKIVPMKLIVLNQKR